MCPTLLQRPSGKTLFIRKIHVKCSKMHLPHPALATVLLPEPAFGGALFCRWLPNKAGKGQQQNCSLRSVLGALVARTHFSRGAFFLARQSSNTNAEGQQPRNVA